MDQTLVGLLGVVIGAFLSGVFLESYKRHHDRRGTASAIVGEIHSILQVTQRRAYADWFRAALAALDKGVDVKLPPTFSPPVNLDPIFATHLDNIGSLGGALPERITVFYAMLNTIRRDIGDMVHGKMDDDTTLKAALIREDLVLWEETAALGTNICDELRAITREGWRPW